MTYSSTVDLSQLPPPSLVEVIDFESIYDAMVAEFHRLWAEKRAARPELPEINVLNLETDPLATAFQVFAYREVLIRARINDAARSNLIAFAMGADLDQLAANFNVQRLVVTPARADAPAVMESDERLRRRVLLAIEAYSTAGPADSYVYHALTADPTLRDASAISPAPGAVTVTIMASQAQPVPTQNQLNKVALALSADDVRPLTDMVSVSAPQVVEVDIVASLTIYPGPDGAIVAQQARDRLNAWLVENAYLGRDLRRSAIFSRLHTEGVLSVDLQSPAADVIVGPRQAVKVNSVTVTISGVDR
ncbi:baseplate assembly protein [Ensifer sp. MPMI2T]|nr:baseplate assembly protein [Ensifer sp. MPMI2T]